MTKLAFFIHTHKCAGTAILNMFARHKFVRMCPDWAKHGGMPEYFRALKEISSEAELEETYGREQIAKFFEESISQHINFLATEWVVPRVENIPFGRDLFCFTVLRDPLRRYLSNYYFDLEKGYSHAKDIYEYRDDSMFRQYNYYTRLFSSRLVRDDRVVTRHDYDRAVAMLRRLDAVIVLEQPETFALLEPLGIDPSRMRHKNVTKRDKTGHPADFEDHFVERAKWDYMLYEEAKRLSSRKLATRELLDRSRVVRKLLERKRRDMLLQ